MSTLKKSTLKRVNYKKRNLKMKREIEEIIISSLSDNEDAVFELLRISYGDFFHHLDPSLLEDNAFILKAIRKSGQGLEYATEEQQDDEELVQLALNGGNDYDFSYASSRIRGDKAFVYKNLKKGKDIVAYMGKNLQNDEEFITTILNEMGYGLRYATTEQRNSKAVVVEALKKYPIAFRGVSSELQKDKVFMLEIMDTFCSWGFEYAHSLLQCDREFVLEALKRDVYGLRIACDELRCDKAFILKAMKLDTSAYYYAHESLKQDRDIVKVIGRKNI